MTDQERKLPVELIPAPKQVNFRSIWGGADQTYLSYDGIELCYSIKLLEGLLGRQYADAPMPEKAAFLAYCKSNQLDPVRGQVYFIKYARDEPAGFVTNWEVFLDRAQRHPQYDGYTCGIVWLVGQKQPKIVRGRPCEYQQDGKHRIIGGWAKVFRKDRAITREVEVPLDEMIGKKRDGSPTKFWRTMLTTMATKTPTARAHRQCFPDLLGGLYAEGENPAFDSREEPPFEPGGTLPPKDLDDVARLIEEGTIGPGPKETDPSMVELNKRYANDQAEEDPKEASDGDE